MQVIGNVDRMNHGSARLDFLAHFSNHTPKPESGSRRRLKSIDMPQRAVNPFLRRLWMLTSFSLAVACAASPTSPPTEPDASTIPLQDRPLAPASLIVTSPDFDAGGPLALRHVFGGFGCTGDNVPPTLSWTGAPPETKSFAIVVHDPDAPTGVGFFHWVVSGIPATTRSVGGEQALPPGAQEHFTDYAASGYGGPCPPPGPEHRYVFTVYALDTDDLQLPEAATGALARFVLGQHTLAFGRLVGTYGR